MWPQDQPAITLCRVPTCPVAYGANYAKLAQITAKWDPGVVFHIDQNIQPTN